MATYSQKVKAVVGKIYTLCSKGTDYYQGYYNYIDEMLSNGEYTIVEDAIYDEWKIDITLYISVDDMKNKTFDAIRMYTASQTQIQLKALMDNNGLYQTSFNIFVSNTNEFLGTIQEMMHNTTNFPFYKDPDLTQIQDDPTNIYLQVIKGGITASTVLIDDGTSIVNKYTEAVSYLLS
jgi:hypothetical protein